MVFYGAEFQNAVEELDDVYGESGSDRDDGIVFHVANDTGSEILEGFGTFQSFAIETNV